jgi:replicative DNA helicase
MDRYIDVLKDKSTLRRVIQVAADITADVYQSNNSKDTMARAESMIQSVTNKAVKGKPKYLSDIAQEWEVTERTEREGGLHIGVLTVDNIMGGVHDGEVMVLAGRPGCGKSALMVQMAIVEAQKGGPCFITSLEMHRHKIYERMLSHLSLVNSRTIWRGVTMESDITSVEYAKGIAMTLPIMLDDCVEDRAEGMLARIKINVQRHKIRTIFVDYIGLMRTAEKFKNRNDELAAISRAFKLLAMELNIRVVVLSQLNRDAAGGRPRVYHLRDSGAIEQDANKIVLISFPEEPDPKSLTTNVLIDVAKNREGMTGAVKCKYDRHTSRFRPTMPGEEYDDEPQAKVKPIIKAGKEGMF